MENTEDLRVQLSKRLIKEGLMRCLKKTELDKLSVSELCRESGVNRSTFYHHYQTPREVLADIGWDHAKKIRRLFEEPAKNISNRERMTKCLSYLYENRDEEKIIFSVGSIGAVGADGYIRSAASDIFSWAWINIIDLKKRMKLDDTDVRLVGEAYGWAAFHIIGTWLMEELPKSPEEITDLLTKLGGGELFGE